MKHQSRVDVVVPKGPERYRYMDTSYTITDGSWMADIRGLMRATRLESRIERNNKKGDEDNPRQTPTPPSYARHPSHSPHHVHHIHTHPIPLNLRPRHATFRIVYLSLVPCLLQAPIDLSATPAWMLISGRRDKKTVRPLVRRRHRASHSMW